MKIDYIKIEDLIPYKLNAKTHPQKQIKGISESINQFGFLQPVVIDKNNNVIIGHGRIEAAKVSKMEELPCLIAEDLTEDQIKALRIIDNKIAESPWDLDLLLADIETFDFDFKPFNIEFPKIQEGIAVDESDNEVPELPLVAVTVLGDIWVCGDHRLACGDSTNPLTVEALMEDRKPNLMVTDPPYGVNYDASWREDSLGAGKRSLGKVENDDVADWQGAYSLFTGNVSYIWHAGKFTHIVAQNIINCGFEIISQIIWAKPHFAISRGDYHWKHEPCWYSVRKGEPHNYQGARDQTTVWEINSLDKKDENEKVGHSTQKPLECMLKPILNNSEKGDYVYDPFGGSGTTMMAAEKSGRKCLMIELSPFYCDVIVKRWQKMTGKTAVNEETGEEFGKPLAKVLDD